MQTRDEAEEGPFHRKVWGPDTRQSALEKPKRNSPAQCSIVCSTSPAAAYNTRNFQVVREGVLIPQQSISVVLSLAPGRDPEMNVGRQENNFQGFLEVHLCFLACALAMIWTQWSAVLHLGSNCLVQCALILLNLIACPKCYCLTVEMTPPPQVTKYCIELCFSHHFQFFFKHLVLYLNFGHKNPLGFGGSSGSGE